MKEINNVVYCNTIFKKFMGLRFHKKIVDTIFVFYFNKPTKISLDMFFVHFPIDVIFLDSNKKIVEIKENFKPYTFYNSKNRIDYVVELPYNYVKKHDLKIGDKINY